MGTGYSNLFFDIHLLVFIQQTRKKKKAVFAQISQLPQALAINFSARANQVLLDRAIEDHYMIDAELQEPFSKNLDRFNGTRRVEPDIRPDHNDRVCVPIGCGMVKYR